MSVPSQQRISERDSNAKGPRTRSRAKLCPQFWAEDFHILGCYLQAGYGVEITESTKLPRMNPVTSWRASPRINCEICLDMARADRMRD